MPSPAVSAQLGHLLSSPPPPKSQRTLFSLILPDWQSPEISRTATATPGPWSSLFLIVSQFLPPSGSVTKMPHEECF